MKESLLQRCETQVRNEEVMRKAGVFEYEIVHKLCAMMHVNAGREIDIERIKDCNRILKEKAGILSNFRGTLQRIVVVKMSLADDPAKYMDDVMDVYGQLKDGTMRPPVFVVYQKQPFGCFWAPAEIKQLYYAPARFYGIH